MNLDKLIRPHLKGLKPYASARSEYLGEGILLDANENAIDSTLEKTGYNRYPDPLQKELKSRIIAWLNPELSIHNIFLGNGSDEALDLLIRAFCEPGRDEILVCPPVFGMFEKSAQINNVNIRKVNLTKEFQLDIDAIKEAIWEHTKIIFICSPNNPSGNLINSEDIKIILSSYEGLLVVDEAYIDFSLATSWVNFLDKYPNLLVLRTFSKAWGLAALRLGMLAGHADIIQVLNNVKMPYNVNSVTISRAMDALSKRDRMEAMVGELNEMRAELSQKLKWMDLVVQVHPSEANFLLVEFREAIRVFEYLKEQGIIVRNRTTQPLCGGCLRITVGNKKENDLLIDLLGRLDREIREESEARAADTDSEDS
jgi:histidinol-phosphate aminotransferase